MIELKNICLYTRHPILNDVNYVFSDQKIYGIVAINGSGVFRILKMGQKSADRI